MARLPDLVDARAARRTQRGGLNPMARKSDQERPAARRGRPRRMALLRRRQHPGRDRPQARRVAPGGAAPRVAGDQRAADQGAARPSDRALHGARRGAEAALRPEFCEVAPTDPASTSVDARHRPGSPRPRWNAGCAGRTRAIIGIGTGRTHARRRRPDAGDGMPAAQAGRAGRHHQVRRLGIVLRRHHPRLRHRARAALSDAAAGDRALGRRSGSS